MARGFAVKRERLIEAILLQFKAFPVSSQFFQQSHWRIVSSGFQVPEALKCEPL